ncbi:hypothetical protein D3C81_1062270 [compost metagenome]
MNKVQKVYTLAKAAYDIAFEGEEWELVEALETPLVEAEGALVEWALDYAEKTGTIPTKLLATLRDRWMFPPHHGKMIELAMKLSI